MVKRRPRIGWTWLFIGLTGCAWLSDDVQPPCPEAVTVADAQNVTTHQPGPGRDLTDVLVEGTIVSVATACDYDEFGRVDTTVLVELDLSIGPAARNDTGQWQYFIAVADPDQKFVAKRVFTIDLQFDQAVFRTRIQESVKAEFAYAPWSNAAAHTIYVGFQLTRGQFDYLRGLKQ